MTSAYDIRCSNVCTHVGITVLILSAISLAVIKPLDKSRELESLLSYTSARLTLVEELARLEKDVAWRGLMATGTAEQARKEWNLEQLLNYTFVEVSKAKDPLSIPEREGSPRAPGPVKGLQVRIDRRIEPLHRMVESLVELGKGDNLALARRYSSWGGSRNL